MYCIALQITVDLREEITTSQKRYFYYFDFEYFMQTLSLKYLLVSRLGLGILKY